MSALVTLISVLVVLTGCLSNPIGVKMIRHDPLKAAETTNRFLEAALLAWRKGNRAAAVVAAICVLLISPLPPYPRF